MSNSRDLEILVAKIQAQLAPGATFTHNAKLPGRNSNVDRQIDVLVRQQIGEYEMLIVLDAKDYKHPVDVKGVEELYGLVQDVGAQRGALVCPKGFTSTAKTRAAGLQIDLYSPVDTDPHKWQAQVRAPCICDFRSAAVSLGIRTSAPMPFVMPYDFHHKVHAFNEAKKDLDLPLNAAIEKWNQGLYPTEPGEHHDLPIYDEPAFVDNGYGSPCPVTLTVSIIVERQLFFGHIPISKLSGFRDELSGKVITNAFTTGIFNIEDVEKNWQLINREEDAPVRPMIRLSGLVGWDPLSALPDGVQGGEI